MNNQACMLYIDNIALSFRLFVGEKAKANNNYEI